MQDNISGSSDSVKERKLSLELWLGAIGLIALGICVMFLS